MRRVCVRRVHVDLDIGRTRGYRGHETLSRSIERPNALRLSELIYVAARKGFAITAFVFAMGIIAYCAAQEFGGIMFFAPRRCWLEGINRANTREVVR